MAEPRPGLFASARAFAATTIRLLQVRVELFATEAEIGTLRLFDAIVLALLAVVGFTVGVALLCGLLLLLVHEEYRLQLLGAMAFAFLLAGVAAVGAARRRLALAGNAFEGTRQELARDVAALTARSP